MHVVFAKA